MRHNRTIIHIAGFLFSIPIALTSYINSTFLKNYISEYGIAIVYAVASLITIWCLLKMPDILNKFGNRKALVTSATVSLVSFLTLGITGSAIMAIMAFILCFISFNLVFFSLDIFIEDFSKNSETGGIRGMYLTFTSLAWVIAQLISGSVISRGSLRNMYFLSALFVTLVVGIFMVFFRDFKDPKYKKVSMIKAVKEYFKSKNISKIYFVSLILKFFYAWMIIYTPIYLHEHIGFAWSQIGIIFSIMLIPFVVLEFPLGKLSDKIGEKKMLIGGFVIMILSTLAIPFVNSLFIPFWALALFLTRVGAATVEVMSESYFFKLVDEEDAEVIGFFRNTVPLSYVIAPLLAILVLYFVPSFKFLFLILSAILMLGLFVSLRLRDVK